MVNKLLLVTILTVTLANVGGCGSRGTFEYRDGTEMAEGPGLFSGSDGSIVSVDLGKEPSKENSFSLQEFINWRQKFSESSEIEQFQMWLELQQSEKPTAE